MGGRPNLEPGAAERPPPIKIDRPAGENRSTEVIIMTGSLSAIGYGLAAIGGGVISLPLVIIEHVARLFTG